MDLSDYRSLPLSFKQHLDDDSSDHAIQPILNRMRDLEASAKEALYEVLAKDRAFLPLRQAAVGDGGPAQPHGVSLALRLRQEQAVQRAPLRAPVCAVSGLIDQELICEGSRSEGCV